MISLRLFVFGRLCRHDPPDPGIHPMLTFLLHILLKRLTSAATSPLPPFFFLIFAFKILLTMPYRGRNLSTNEVPDGSSWSLKSRFSRHTTGYTAGMNSKALLQKLMQSLQEVLSTIPQQPSKWSASSQRRKTRHDNGSQEDHGGPCRRIGTRHEDESEYGAELSPSAQWVDLKLHGEQCLGKKTKPPARILSMSPLSSRSPEYDQERPTHPNSQRAPQVNSTTDVQAAGAQDIDD